MRIILSSVKCDWCEANYEIDSDDLDDVDLAAGLARAGWYYVEHDNREYDLCSQECLVSKFS